MTLVHLFLYNPIQLESYLLGPFSFRPDKCNRGTPPGQKGTQPFIPNSGFTFAAQVLPTGTFALQKYSPFKMLETNM